MARKTTYFSADKASYMLGCAKLRAWHDVCRDRRLGMPEARRKLEERDKKHLSFNWCGRWGAATGNIGE